MSSSDLLFKPLAAIPAPQDGFEPLAVAAVDAAGFRPLWSSPGEAPQSEAVPTEPTEEEKLEAVRDGLRKEQEAQLEAMEERLQQLVASLGEELDQSAAERQDRIAERCVDLALKIAARVVADEVQTDPSRLVGILRDGLAATELRDGLEVVVHPDDEELMAAALDSLRPLGVEKIVTEDFLAPSSLLVRRDNQEWEMGVDVRLSQVGDEIIEALGRIG